MKPCDRVSAFSLRMLESCQEPLQVAMARSTRPCLRRHFTALMSLSTEGSSLERSKLDRIK